MLWGMVACFLLLSAGALVLYWRMPSLAQLQPQLRAHLMRQLELESLDLGRLSWSWTGHIWLRAEGIDVKGRTFAYRGTVDVMVPLWRLLLGDMAPQRVRLSGGELDVHPALDATSPDAMRLPGELLLDHVAVHWRYGSYKGAFPYLSLLLTDGGRLEVTGPDLSLRASLDARAELRQLELYFSGLSWLPASWRAFARNLGEGEVYLHHRQGGQWEYRVRLSGEQGFTLFPNSPWALPARTLAARGMLRCRAGSAPWQGFSAWKISELTWRYGDNALVASGGWARGVFSLQARTDSLAMPLLWQGLRPLDSSAEWRQWLGSMHDGHVTQARAKVEFPWPRPWAAWPEASALDDGLRFRVQGDVQGADIALGLAGDVLRQVRARVSLDEQALDAQILDCQLPEQVGRAHAKLHLPWSTLLLDIQGKGRVDPARLARWQAREMLRHADWRAGMALAEFHIQWPAASAHPKDIRVALQPEGEWRMVVHQVPLDARDGRLSWDLHGGLTVTGMQVQTGLGKGTVSLSANKDEAGDWQVRDLQARFDADLANIVAAFELPVAGAGGRLDMALDIKDGRLQGRIDMTRAAWRNLLGTSKERGLGEVVNLAGKIQYGAPTAWLLSDIRGQGTRLQLQGAGRLERDEFTLHFTHVQSGAFNGAVLIRFPLGDKPWRLDVDARFLDRSALPETLVRAAHVKPWRLHARIDRFNWGEAALQGVEMRLDSGAGSEGRFHAGYIQTSGMNLQQVDCAFVLPGGGTIDVRELTAEIEKQRLYLSALLLPADGGGVAWHGFAMVSGDFGQLMRKGELSQRFIGGQMRAVFLGAGILLRDQPWWRGLSGRLRLRVDKGRILEGGAMTKLLALLSLADLPKLLIGQRKDLVGPGMMYERLQMEGVLRDQHFEIYNLAMRASALDMAGRGSLDFKRDTIDLLMIVHPLQHLDALLGKIPLLRDVLGGKSHSLLSKVFRMRGKMADAEVKEVPASEREQAKARVVEGLFSLPDRWFGGGQVAPAK